MATFLTVLIVKGILCSFKLVLEGKAGKEILVLLSLKFSDKDFRKQHLKSIKQRRNSWFTYVESTIGNSTCVMSAKILRGDRVASISKFDSFKKPFLTIISLSEFGLEHRRIILLIQKGVIFMSYDSSTRSWKEMRFDLIFTTKEKYINFQTGLTCVSLWSLKECQWEREQHD